MNVNSKVCSVREKRENQKDLLYPIARSGSLEQNHCLHLTREKEKKRANKLMGENTQQYPNATAVGFFRHHAHSAAEISSMLSVSFLLCFVCVHANIHTFKKGHFPISVVIPVAVIII